MSATLYNCELPMELPTPMFFFCLYNYFSYMSRDERRPDDRLSRDLLRSAAVVLAGRAHGRLSRAAP